MADSRSLGESREGFREKVRRHNVRETMLGKAKGRKGKEVTVFSVGSW